MKRLALAAALAASFAAPAFADGHAASFAIMHFNMDADSAGDLRMAPQGDAVTADLTMGSSLAEVFSHLNMDAENMGDVRGANGSVTIIASDPAHAQEIFARLMAESAEDE